MKKSRLIWYVLIGVVLVIAAISFVRCNNSGTSVPVSDYSAVISKMHDGELDKTEVADGSDNTVIKAVYNAGKNVDYDKVKIDYVLFDGYNLEFTVKLVKTDGEKEIIKRSIPFTSVYGRTNMQ
ncbi:MAG: hypothetical protein J6W87_04275 [Clostridia bacterium]|nr:hypothetical protein [Clostridia bacterium]